MVFACDRKCKIRHVGFENRSPSNWFRFQQTALGSRILYSVHAPVPAAPAQQARTKGSDNQDMRGVCQGGAADVARGCDVHQEAWTRFGCLHAHRGSWRDSSTEGSSGWPLLPMSSHPSHVSCLELHQMLKLVRPPNLDTIIIRFVAHGEPNRSFKWLPCQAGRNASRSRERIW